jgi:hypothetical protein
MDGFALVILLTFGLALVGIVYGAVAVIRSRVRLTRRRELVGYRARLVGVFCVLASVGFWWWLVRMWSYYTP